MRGILGGVVEWIHDREVDTSATAVRTLLTQQVPELADRPLTYLDESGTSNTLWRMSGDGGGERDCIVRLPRTPSAEASILTEHRLLPALQATDVARRFQVPELLHTGLPSSAFPLHWMITGWIDGLDAWQVRQELAQSPGGLIEDLTTAIGAISSATGLPVPDRSPGQRGGPIGPLLDRLRRWLDDPKWSADRFVDVRRVGRLADQAAELADEPVAVCTVHGDLLPGNLLVAAGRLRAVIDWGGAGCGDPAQDLTPAWALFDDDARATFRSELEVDDATWLRGRANELEHAVGGVLYYRPRGHVLGEIMARTLDRVLAD